MPRRTLMSCVAVSLAAFCSPGLLGQPVDSTTDPAPQPAGGPSLQEMFVRAAQADPPRRSGLRAELIRRSQQTIPTVVIVEDARSYLAAIAGWQGTQRFPVMWDDGSLRSREGIARFVRAFEPERVVRYRANEAADAWPTARKDREHLVRETLAHAVRHPTIDGPGTFEDTLADLARAGIVSPGIVLTDVDDTAWPAAIALSAGRFQPIAFTQRPGAPWPPLSSEQATLLEEVAQTAAEKTGRPWREVGDDIDAVTICLNTGTRVKTGPGARDFLATTSRIGRFGADGAGERWAYSGQIIGGYSDATYRAMCALFLAPDDAFVFDGYQNGEPWDNYDGTAAAGAFREAGLEVQLHDHPNNTKTMWRSVTARPLSPGIMLINSKGPNSRFYLKGGNAHTGDIPILAQPTLVHMVHSFSLQSPRSPNTIGGRLLMNGAYAMIGSVDEPYLTAFVPTPAVARRMLGTLAFGVAGQFDDGEVWKIACLGDPLITLGPPTRRISDADTLLVASLPGEIIDAEDDLKESLANRQLAFAAETLITLGRDADAARLAIALMDQPRAEDTEVEFDADFAFEAIPALFRDGKHLRVLDAAQTVSADQMKDPVIADCTWFAARFLLNGPERSRAQAFMRTHLREGTDVFDAVEVAQSLARRSVAEGQEFLAEIRAGTDAEWKIRELDKAIRELGLGRP